MPTSYKHLLVISDGEVLESSLYRTDRDRAERLIEMIQNDEIGDGQLSEDVEEVMQEADEDAAQADYPEGVAAPTRLDPEDYLDALKDFLSGRDIDLYLEDLQIPDDSVLAAVGAE